LLYAIELAAWHLFFGLSVLLAASAFRDRGREAAVRRGLRATGLLCLVGLVGPAVGNLDWRMIGVIGYALLFPVTCVVIALVFHDAPAGEGAS
jgi:peptidoglycan/LPS O-acetylase OafA/YrhL